MATDDEVDMDGLRDRITNYLTNVITVTDTIKIIGHLRKVYFDIYITTCELWPSEGFFFRLIKDAVMASIGRQYDRVALQHIAIQRWSQQMNYLRNNVIRRDEEYNLIIEHNCVIPQLYTYFISKGDEPEVHERLMIAHNEDDLLFKHLDDCYPSDYRDDKINQERENRKEKYGDFKEMTLFKREIDPYDDNTIVEQVAIIEYEDRYVEMINAETVRTVYKRDLFRSDVFRPIHSEMLFSLDTPKWYHNEARRAFEHFESLKK